VRLLEAGFTQQEIAEAEGITQQAVSFRVGGIRKKLNE
jgi:DNA-binding CsgD family transcriptional regulator